MSAPAVIDTGDFARSGEELHGSVEVGTLKRLEDVLYDPLGSLDYVVTGSLDARNRPQLGVTVTGRLHLQCQRCLGLLDYEVGVDNTVLVIERGAPYDPELDDPEGPDAIEGSAELDVAMLIEDEVLLSLPISPRHEEGACAAVLDNGAKRAGASLFARLDALKDSRDRN